MARGISIICEKKHDNVLIVINNNYFNDLTQQLHFQYQFPNKFYRYLHSVMDWVL